MLQKKLQASHIVFILILLLVVSWIASGMLGSNNHPQSIDEEPNLPTIAASWSEAQSIHRKLVIYGDAQPIQVSIVRARTDGLVEDIVGVGQTVRESDKIARLSMDDRQVRLAQAKAQVASSQRDYDAVNQLIERNLASDSERQLRLAQLESARAALRAIEFEIENTQVKAPINGTVNHIFAEQGSFVTLGGQLLEIVDNNPLLAVIQVQQAEIANIQLGQTAKIRFVGGEERTGQVRFISPIGDAKTRTFRVEIEIDNSQNPLPSGLSAEVTLELDAQMAHQISPALIRLDENGQAGIYIVNGQQTLEFKPIEIVRADGKAIWVNGLERRVQIATLTHGALADGQKVNVQPTPNSFSDQTQGTR
ncbi:efflux RND transporter periplasmic adaptor subunit [Thiomicrospira sp.]|uniref:efflux RND transporter periplasmic adaptor subunit n=1 Tax=Thiomicrospira sp. TaxID=935 RepID=UPI002F925CF9